MLQKISRAQRAITSLEMNTSLEGWAENVALTLRDILMTENIYFIEPGMEPGVSSGGPDQLKVLSPLSGHDFAGGISSHFTSYDDAGFSLFKESYSTFLHRVIRCGGTKAIHDAPLYCREQQEQSELYQTVLGPAGIQRQMALSTPLVRGEAMLIAGFDHDAIPDFDGEQHQAFSLLLPAFEAAIRFRTKLKGAEKTLFDTLEKTGECFAFVNRDKALKYCSTHLQKTLASCLDQTTLINGILDAAAAVAGLASANGSEHCAAKFTHSLTVSGIRVHLNAHPVMSVNGNPNVLVFVKSLSVTSRVEVLGHEYNLTGREVEVAALIANGYRDKEIARQLAISPNTARRHSEAILRKLGISNRSEVLPLIYNVSSP